MSNNNSGKVEDYYWICHPEPDVYPDAKEHITHGTCREHEIAGGASIASDVLAELISSKVNGARIDELQRVDGYSDIKWFNEYREDRIRTLKNTKLDQLNKEIE